MYVPKCFSVPEDRTVRAVLAATRFAVVVSARVGTPSATHLPVIYKEDAGEIGAFRAHFSRANPHWKELGGGSQVLVICPGPNAYISPAWYRSREVPTWDYIAVHAWCRPRIIDDRRELEAVLDELMCINEDEAGTGRRYADYPADFLDRQLRGIVGVELAITRVEAAFKLSQNRSAEDRASVCAHLRAVKDSARAALADAIERYAPAD